MSRDATWVVNPYTKFEHDTTYRSRVRTTTIFHWLPVFTFFGGKGGQISNLIYLTPKRHFLGGNDVLSVWMCPKMRPVGVAKKRKKGQTLMRQTGY